MVREDQSASSLRVLGTRNDAAELAAIDTTILKSGALVFVIQLGGVFALLKDSTKTPDGINTVQPSAGLGRWIRQNPGSQQYADQREWFIHADGDDLGPGTSDAPLRTGAELSRRLATVIEPEETFVYYMSDMQPTDYLFGPLGCAPNATFIVMPLGTLPVLAEVTLTGAQAGNPATNARNRVDVAGQPNWAAALGGKFFEVVNKPAVGGWLDKVDPADNTRAFISMPLDIDEAFTATLEIGDVLRFTERRSLGQGLALGGGRYAGGDRQFEIFDMRVVDNGDFASGAHLSYAGQAYRCDFGGYSMVAQYFANFINCSFEFDPGLGYLDIIGDVAIIGGFNRGRQLWGGPGLVQMQGLTHSDTNIECRGNLEFDVAFMNSSFWDWPGGAALELEPGCFFNQRIRAYGTSAAANTYAVDFNTGSMGHYASGASQRPNIIGTLGTGGSNTRDFLVGGTNFLYAALPFVNTTNNTRFVVRQA